MSLWTRRRESATKEATLIKSGRFTRLAGFKALAAQANGGQSGGRKNESCQAEVEKSPLRDGQGN